MKKQFLLFMLFATCALAFTGCEKDSDDDVNIQGKWIVTKEVSTEEQDGVKNTETEVYTDNNFYLFLKEGNVFELWSEGEKESTGTYQVSADKKTITVTFSDYSMSAKITTLSSSALVLEFKEEDGTYKYTEVTTYKRG